MNERLVDGERPIIAHDQPPEVAEPGDAAFDNASLPVTAQHAPVLRRGPVPIRTVRGKQDDAASPQSLAQRIAVVALAGDHPRGLLSWVPAAVASPDPNRLERFFRQPDLRRGSRIKSDSQRNTPNPARNARQILSQTPCSSQSPRQQVDGEENSSGKSCHRAPLRNIVVDHFSCVPVFVGFGIMPLICAAILWTLVGPISPASSELPAEDSL